VSRPTPAPGAHRRSSAPPAAGGGRSCPPYLATRNSAAGSCTPPTTGARKTSQASEWSWSACGNSGAQIAADLTGHAKLTWATSRPPRFLADEIDGRALFDATTARRHALDNGHTETGGVAALGDIVAVPPVRTARDTGLLRAVPMFTRLTAQGP
jgi:hypothetical protein